MADAGEIYSVKISFDDNVLNTKIRPVLIVNYYHEDNTYVIAEITKTEPKIPPTYYDQYKELITNWKLAGLHVKSYVKTHKLHRIETNCLLKRIGKTDETDFENIIKKVIENNN